MGMITNDWLEAIQPEFSKPYYKELYSFVKDELRFVFKRISVLLKMNIVKR